MEGKYMFTHFPHGVYAYILHGLVVCSHFFIGKKLLLMSKFLTVLG